ncbi:MAG TPA: glucose-1-phosphate adenylyltransferase [Bryobacteraceae bacterium]|nr:glucose-1-phosphate adenylyltransferase [Bryobacteraceae bacterium]
MENVLAILLAGGAGERLFPLTQNTAKPAVPFGGIYRIIDFTLSNCINSDIRRILVLTQYKALELIRHLRDGWTILSPEMGEYIEVIPPMKRIHEDWYLGTADAVYQNIHSVAAENPRELLLLSGDHIYKMNYHEMLAWHHQQKADVTIATIQAPPEEAPRFGVVEIGPDYRVTGFEEKPRHGNPVRSRFNPEMISASMGVYVFNTETALRALVEDAEDPNSSHDFGHDIIPRWLQKSRVIAYDFADLNDKTVKYWRDVGTLDAYYEANMDLVSIIPEFNLYDKRWPIRTHLLQQPPAKFVFAQEGRRMGIAIDSIVAGGCIVSGGRVVRSILSPGVRINSYCEVESSIVMHNAEVGRYSRVRRAIIGQNVRIPESSVIGYDIEADRAKGYTVTDSGIVVICNNEEVFSKSAPYSLSAG